MPDQQVAKTLWASGECLGSVFLGGILGNLAASLAWETGKYAAKPLLDKVPELAELLRQGGQDRNHDLLRSLRRAECAALVETLNVCILQHSGLQMDSRNIPTLLKARWRSRVDPTLDVLCRARRAFSRLHSDLETMSLERLVLLNGGGLSGLPTLVESGSECFATDDVWSLREKVVNDYVDWLSDAVTAPARFTGIADEGLAPLIADGLPSVVVDHIRRHPGGWWDCLRLAFRETLKDPANARARSAWDLDIQSRLRDQLGNSFAELDDSLASIDLALQRQWDFLQLMRDDFEELTEEIVRGIRRVEQRAGEISDELARLRRQFSICERPVFFTPHIGDTSRFGATYKPFYFGEEEDEFVGREATLVALRSDLLNPAKDTKAFRWAVICGDAGTGKSRLALHIINSESATWPFSGFVRESFIQSVATEMNSLAEIPGPTLFVVDYAAGAPDACCRFLERCAALAHTAPFPVRALVLLRRSSDRFFEAVARQRDGATAMNCQVTFPPSRARSGDRSGALFLDRLADADVKQLMEKRVQRATREMYRSPGSIQTSDVPGEKLLTLLRRYDTQMRPLFAAMVADAYARGLLPDHRASSASQEQTRLNLFWDYLEHEYRKRWSASYTGLNEASSCERIDRHLSFLILSTMCRGLTTSGWGRLLDDANLGPSSSALFPTHPLRFDSPGATPSSQVLDEEHLLAALAGSVRNSAESEAYPILEPDLIAESLVLLLFEERGKALCGQGWTAERRRSFLRDHAWCADAGGAAFFAVMVAQDFPEQAAKVDWLLPSRNLPNIALERAQLFCNLALATVAPLRTRSASLADVQRMDQLEARFPLDASEAVDVQSAHADAVLTLARHLAFVINKSVVPLEPDVEALPDKLGKRAISFAVAATPDDDRATSGHERRDSQSALQDQSDSATKAAATTLLLRLLKQATKPAFLGQNLEVRLKHASILGLALSSALWEHRNKQEKLGFAAVALTSEERQLRSELAMRCVELLKKDDLDQDSVAIAASVTKSLVYAEYGLNSTRGHLVYEAILRLYKSNGFASPLAMLQAMGFLENYLFLQINAALHPSKRIEETPSFTELSEMAAELFRMAFTQSQLRRTQIGQLVDSWCGIAMRLDEYEKKRHRPTLPGLRRAVDTLIIVTGHLQELPISSGVMELYGRLFEESARQAVDPFADLRVYSAAVQARGFDPVSTNQPSWRSLAWHLSVMRKLAATDWPMVQPIFESALKQIGGRARDAVCDILLNQLPGPGHADSIDLRLARMVLGEKPLEEGSERCRMLAMAVMMHRLISGEQQNVLSEMEAMWSEGTRENDFVRRTNVMPMLPAVLAWLGLDDPDARRWRNRLAAMFFSPEPVEASSQAVVTHHRVAVETATRLAQLEVRAGRDADDWLPKGRTHD